MIYELSSGIGSAVIGAAILFLWAGGAIAGSDFFSKNVSKHAGDWFGIIWAVGIPVLCFLYVALK